MGGDGKGGEEEGSEEEKEGEAAIGDCEGSTAGRGRDEESRCLYGERGDMEERKKGEREAGRRSLLRARMRVDACSIYHPTVERRERRVGRTPWL